MPRRPSTRFVLYAQIKHLECWIRISMPSLNDNHSDPVVATFPTLVQCETFIRTAYHQKKTPQELVSNVRLVGI